MTEKEPVAASIARLLQPSARVISGDFTHTALNFGNLYDLAIGNPPFASETITGGPVPLSLHEHFIWRSVAALRPGGLAAFVCSRYLMDKGETKGRDTLHGFADFLGGIRLPEKAMRFAAGTDVVADILLFRRRIIDQPAAGERWLDTVGVQAQGGQVAVNRYFAEHPEMVLGTHALTTTQHGIGYTCLQRDGTQVAAALDAAVEALTETIARRKAPEKITRIIAAPPPIASIPVVDTRPIADGGSLREGSYLIDEKDRLCQIGPGGQIAPVIIRRARGIGGISPGQADIIRDMIPIRDCTRAILTAQAADEPWAEHVTRLHAAYARFVERHRPINLTNIVYSTRSRRYIWLDEETGEERSEIRETESTSYRRPNLSAFEADPDRWLVASIESYDIDTGEATPGPIFTKRVCRPAPSPKIESPSDALACCLNDRGRVDLEWIGAALDLDPMDVATELDDLIYLDPETREWVTADAYLSGKVRSKLAAAEAASAIDRQYRRNVEALRLHQPTDLRPSEISARLGAPWISVGYIQQFCFEVLGVKAKITHGIDLAVWDVEKTPFMLKRGSEWGTQRRHAGLLLEDALNSRSPKIFDREYVDGKEHQVLNERETELARDKLDRMKKAFGKWVWGDVARSDALMRVYNARFNDMMARHFDGKHLTLPGASILEPFYAHQLNAIWRIITDGSTYVAHTVGAGKTRVLIAAAMEQRRLGLVTKPMVVVPSNTLTQWAGEWMRLYPSANIIVADETNFTADKRKEFLARAATGDWDGIIVTHDAFKFIAVPRPFERDFLTAEVSEYEDAILRTDDRITRKGLEDAKSRLLRRLDKLATRKDDLLTIDQIGPDQLMVDEFQAYRKLSFTSNARVKGIDPNGSTRAQDMFMKIRYIDERINRGRAIVPASGTPISNTMGELFGLQRFMNPEDLRARGVHRFDAWVATFGEVTDTIELQPGGNYKIVSRLSKFINVPELTAMFRARADVVMKQDIMSLLRLPLIHTGSRQIVAAPPDDNFKRLQRSLAKRIELIELRKGPARKGDDIKLAVITDGRHHAISTRFGNPDYDNNPDDKLNRLIASVHNIWRMTAGLEYRNPATGQTYPRRGASQMIFSDIGTLAVEERRGFSAYSWIRSELIRLGVPESEIAIVHEYPGTGDKQRLWNQLNSGVKRIAIGSSEKMGTGANAQQRLIALHHLDVPWMPYLIEQREGRIHRQGNQNREIHIFAYATETSMDAPMWQTLERKLDFVMAALRGDRSVRTMEDIGDDEVSQFRLAKAIASGDPRLMRKADLDDKIARETRLYEAHIDEQFTIRRQIERAKARIEKAEHMIPIYEADIAMAQPLPEDGFLVTIQGREISDKKEGNAALIQCLRRIVSKETEGTEDVGFYRGFKVSAETRRLSFDGKDGDLTMDLDVQLSHDRTFSPTWNVNTPGHVIYEKIDTKIAAFPSQIDFERAEIANMKDVLLSYGPRQNEVFDRSNLDAMIAERDKIESDLSGSAG